MFTRIMGRPPRRTPVTYMEKLNWRVVHDRRPLVAFMGDKLKMKQWGVDHGKGLVKVPATYWSGTDVSELEHVELPDHWVLKPNHSTARVYFGSGRPDLADIRAKTAGWLEHSMLDEWGEWVYTQADKVLLVEALLGPPGGDPPTDYKVFVFDGVPKLLAVDTSRFSGHHRRFYRPDWTPLDTYADRPLAPVEPQPGTLDQMLQAAATLGAPFDHVRVDLYDIDGEVYLGEMSLNPWGGIARFHPPDLDFELGSYWTLPPKT